MADEMFWLGPCPAEEDAVQLGSPDYARDAKTQCRAYVEAIRAVCGREPEGARLVVKSQSHDFGTYYECAVAFDPEIEAARDYAALVDDKAPTTWAAAGMSEPAPGRSR